MIYLLMAHCPHEGDVPLKAYADKAKAETVCDQANTYQLSRPSFCEEDSYDKWYDAHPAPNWKDHSSGYVVLELEFEP